MVNRFPPVKGSVPLDAPLVDPLDAADVGATVNGKVAVREAPTIDNVCAPASSVVGSVTVFVTLPVLSATAVPKVTGVDCTMIVVVSPGMNPVADIVTC